MIETPTGIDIKFSQIELIEDNAANTFEIRALTGNTPDDIEYSHTTEDVLDVDISNEELVESTTRLSEDIRENLTEIITQHERIYSDPFTMYYRITTAEWEDLFGTKPPTPLESWEPLWELGKTEFIVGYQTNADAGRDHPLSVDPFKHILDNPEETILPIRITPALALSEVGTMSLPQARAYILHQWGYETSAIAELIEKPSGTVSSHLTRGRKKATQATWMSEFTTHIQTVAPRDYQHIFDRVGNTYYFDEDKEYYRVQGLYDDDGEFVYKLLCEHGSRYVSVEYFVENAEQIHESSLDKLPPVVQKADVMDTDELIK